MWHTLADKYIEEIKGREDKKEGLIILDRVYKTCLKLLHPFMPFTTEKIWQEIQASKIPLIVSQWPEK